MAQAAGELPVAVLEQVHARATAQYADWKANSSAEQKAKANEDVAKYNDPANAELKAQHRLQMADTWNQSDADGDGRLNLTKFKAFMTAMNKIKSDRGDWVETGDHSDADYAMGNAIDPENEGISSAQLKMLQGPWFAKRMELKAADGL